METVRSGELREARINKKRLRARIRRSHIDEPMAASDLH